MWPSVAYIVDEKRLGTAYSVMTLIQQIGVAGMNYLIGVEAGVEVLHTAPGPLANGPSLPSTEQTILATELVPEIFEMSKHSMRAGASSRSSRPEDGAQGASS